MTGQQQLWTQLEAFARQSTAASTREVAYLVANEGRRLIECDRVSVAVRYGRQRQHRGRQRRRRGREALQPRAPMRKLCDHVMNWGEKLVFNGTRDDSLPPKVLEALDDYLAESTSKLLVVLPLKDEREKARARSRRGPRWCMECFEPPAEPQQHLARLDVVAKHATSALYNAVEHRRIPIRFVWMPLAKLQEGVGGQTSAIVMACCVAADAAHLRSSSWSPTRSRWTSNGKLLPQTRCYVYAPMAGPRRALPGRSPASRSPRAAAWSRCTTSRTSDRRSSTLQQDIDERQRQTEAIARRARQDKNLDADGAATT